MYHIAEYEMNERKQYVQGQEAAYLDKKRAIIKEKASNYF